MLKIETKDTNDMSPGLKHARTKSDEQLGAEIANQFVKLSSDAVGRCATLVKELTEAEAAMELANHSFKTAYLDIQDKTKEWLTGMRQFRIAIEGEFRTASKGLADITEYFEKQNVRQAVADLRDLCDVIDRVAKLHADPSTQKLIEAVLKLP